MSNSFQTSQSDQASLLWILISFFFLSVVLALHDSLVIPSISLPRLDAQIVAALLGALIGSIGAAIGIVVTGKMKEQRNRDHERQVKHYNSLVRLQWQINVIRATMEDNAQALKGVVEAGDVGLPTFQRPVTMTIDVANLMDLYDLKLINLLNDLYYDIRRLNLDTTNLSRVLDTLAEQRFAGTIGPQEYRTEVSAFRQHVVSFRQQLLYKLDHEVLDLAAYIRICVDRDATLEDRARFKRVQKDRTPVADEDVSKMRDTILAELSQQEFEGERILAETAAYDPMDNSNTQNPAR